MKKIQKFIILLLMALIINPISNKIINSNSNETLGIVKVNTKLNVRSEATINSKIITKLNNNSYLIIQNQKNNFYYVEYQDNKYGYVNKSYVREVKSEVKKVTASRLNVRSEASLSSKINGSLVRNELVYSIEVKNGFSKIVYQGNKIGYASNLYLTSTSSLNLNVPSYKQFDERWSNIKMGNSNYTIGKSGCLTTSIAMLESYRQNRTIYPSYIAKNYSYTSNGSLYWPSNYLTSTSSSYLSLINKKLKENKPVIIGLKKANGSTHFIVIKGIKNSSSTSLTNYLVNDPGSSYRSTLDEAMKVYPYFYKLAYYK